MTTEIPKQYEPAAAEAKWFPYWESHGYFNADPNPAKPPHVIMIPLPNVTGALHMGHALNGTLQDLLTRWRRMQGYEALWMPGTDHAGIATQSMVEKRMLEQEGLTRHDVGREALIKRIWDWKDAYEKRILSQLKSLGASCDWRRVRFTLDEVCSRAVRQTFFKMFKDGLIFRGKRLVNWDTFLQTAVADDEVYEEEIDGHFWTFNYPVVNEAGQPTGERISFSTTRPETMLGDTAVCVHPTDERYTHLIGKHVRIPVNGRTIPIVADALLADKTLGTGCVKVTPAHDPNDYACWTRNKEKMGEPINILNPDGTLNENGGPWQGQDRLVARDAVVAEMEKLGHFEKVEDRKIPLKHSDRSKTPVEPYLSEQWFVKMDTLAQAAIDAANDGRVTFYPERYKQSYVSWLSEKRDWCISRQLWWGHRIPVWSGLIASTPGYPESIQINYEKAESELRSYLTERDIFQDEYSIISSEERDSWKIMVCPATDRCAEALTLLAKCIVHSSLVEWKRATWDEFEEPECNGKQVVSIQAFIQDEDVLDTWFSSALWPHATLGWPDRDHNPPMVTTSGSALASSPSATNEVLNYFYPGSVLVTSRDIITLWVARMVLTGLYNMGDIPFKHVCIHPKIQDGFGQGMSKTKGNGVDPNELIAKYGCDGMRFTIASFAGETQDVRLPVGYECPHCQAIIPQEQHHLKFKPGKPKIKCPKCKKESQYATPNYTPDEGEPVARIVIERFEYGRNFSNKLWNAARFAMLNLEGYTPAPVADAELAIEDRWILSRLATVTDEVSSCLNIYKFDAATRSLRDFVWNEFCDWYLEMIKPRLRDEAQKPAAQRVLVTVLDTILRLLHPFTPFITEELWQRLKEIAPARGLPNPTAAADAIIVAPWPTGLDDWRDAALEARFQRLQELIVAVRNVRGTYNISPTVTVPVAVKCTAEVAADLNQVRVQFEMLAKSMLSAAGPEVTRPDTISASFSLGDADGYLPLESFIDLEAELVRQQKEAEKVRGFIAGHEKKLTNQSFVDRAPPEVVAEVRDTLAGLQKQLASIEEIIKQLGG
ncbi:MAG TPA: valine--tRNA ligase [Schlesneria sp.]